MRCRQKRARVGDVVTVSDSYHYPLPEGLKAGTQVKLVAFDHGYWTVEVEGRQFVVFLARVNTGFEYELGGRWVPEQDVRGTGPGAFRQ